MNDIGPEVSCSPEDATVSCVAKDYLCIVDRVNCSLQKIKSELVSNILDFRFKTRLHFYIQCTCKTLLFMIVLVFNVLTNYNVPLQSCTCSLLFGYLEGPSDSVTKST